jgi:hypothetical protein
MDPAASVAFTEIDLDVAPRVVVLGTLVMVRVDRSVGGRAAASIAA